MEKKTMGAFIAVLRKASGMTQRELAERLNVSDKAVSRWERDETAPDISLIPVIADVFGVTTDELLRGERRSPEKQEPAEEGAEQALSAKSGKELSYLLKKALAGFKIRSIVSAGIAAAGIAIAYFVYYLMSESAKISWPEKPSFWLGAAFVLAAVICQIAFTLKAFSAADDDEIRAFEGTPQYFKKVTLIAAAAFAMIVLLFSVFVERMLLDWEGVFFVTTLCICTVAFIAVKILAEKRANGNKKQE